MSIDNNELINDLLIICSGNFLLVLTLLLL
jgi:hypothetical protein